MIEYVSRITKNHRGVTVSYLGEKGIEHELSAAEVNHCLSFEQVCDEWIEQYGIQNGKFDTVEQCLYDVPSVTAIGRVYQKLIIDDIEDNKRNIIDAVIKVFSSFISDKISDFNASTYYSNPDYLKCSYNAGVLLL